MSRQMKGASRRAIVGHWAVCVWMLFLVSAAASEQTEAPVQNAALVQVISWTCDASNDTLTIAGDVKNSSGQSLDIAPIGMFRRINGQLVMHEQGTLAFTPLQPDQSSPFKVVGRASTQVVADCEISFRDQKTGARLNGPDRFELPSQLPLGGDSRRGRFLFNGKGVCFACHGKDGNPEALTPEQLKQIAKLNPKPTNLQDRQKMRFRKSKARFRAIKYGIPGTGMVPMQHLTDEEILDAVRFLDVLDSDDAE